MVGLKPTQDTIDRMNREGYSFLYNVSPEHEARYEEWIHDGCIRYVPVSITGRLSATEITVKHAPKLGIQPDRIKVLTDAYRHECEGLSNMAAVFVRTEDLDGILQRKPFYRLFQT